MGTVAEWTMFGMFTITKPIVSSFFHFETDGSVKNCMKEIIDFSAFYGNIKSNKVIYIASRPS